MSKFSSKWKYSQELRWKYFKFQAPLSLVIITVRQCATSRGYCRQMDTGLLRLSPQGQSRCFQSIPEIGQGTASVPHWRASSLFSLCLVCCWTPVPSAIYILQESKFRLRHQIIKPQNFRISHARESHLALFSLWIKLSVLVHLI